MIKRTFKCLVVLTLCTLQWSCGFKPIYQSKHATATIPPIHIMPINSVEGAIFYDTLSQLIEDDASSKYALYTQLTYANSNLVIAPNSSVVEERVTQTVVYSIIDENSGTTVVSGATQILGDVETLLGAYTTYEADLRVKENLARRAATEIQGRLAMHFNKTKPAVLTKD